MATRIYLAFVLILSASVAGCFFPETGGQNNPVTGEKPAAAAEVSDTDLLWSDMIRDRILNMVAGSGRQVKSPKWVKRARAGLMDQPFFMGTGYLAIGHMPLVLTGLLDPLLLPDIALRTDGRARQAGGSLYGMFCLADEMANQAEGGQPNVSELLKAIRSDKDIPADVLEFLSEFENPGMPGNLKGAFIVLVRATAIASVRIDKAFAGLSDEERKTLSLLMPQYFLPIRNGEPTFRCYTVSEMKECVEVWRLARKIDFSHFIFAAQVLAAGADESLRILKKADINISPKAQFIVDRKTSIGRIVIGNRVDTEYKKDCAVTLDIGGNDRYLNNAGGSVPGSINAAVVIDISGNDRYEGGDACQGAGYCGVGILADLSGDDVYKANNHAQGAGLLGFGLLMDEAGNDSYSGNLGLQGYALYGYGVLNDRSGNDEYRVATFGQGFAATCGVASLIEEGGDDRYSAGGKYGFYTDVDSGGVCGAATGMRVYPYDKGYTVYGGIGFLSEQAGNDFYNCGTFAWGGSYLLALGMAVESGGNDTYTGADYVGGSGCHLGAAVFIDREGNDTYKIKDHSLGATLDLSSGIMLELGGDDTYAGVGCIGHAVKPLGVAVFADVSGNDSYLSERNTLGYARPPYGPHIPSSSFFFDFQGTDKYKTGFAADNTEWKQYRYGEAIDTEIGPPENQQKPRKVFETAVAGRKGINSYSTLERITGIGELTDLLENDGEKAIEALKKICGSSHAFSKLSLKDFVTTVFVEKISPENEIKVIRTLLETGDEVCNLIALWAIRLFEIPLENIGPLLVGKLKSSPSDDVRSYAAYCLGKGKAAEALGELVRNLSQSPHAGIRRNIARALVDLPGKATVEALSKAVLNDPDEAVRSFAAESLGKIGDEGSIGVFKKALEDKMPFVRLAAARALVLKYRDPAGIDGLIELAGWKNGTMVKSRITPILEVMKGGKCKTKEEWAKWWKDNRESIDFNARAEACELKDRILEFRRRWKHEEALPTLREGLENEHLKAYCEDQLFKVLIMLAQKSISSGKDLEKALSYSGEAVKLKKDFTGMDTHATLLYVNGREEEAVSLLKEAIEAAPAEKKEPLLKKLEQMVEKRFKL